MAKVAALLWQREHLDEVPSYGLVITDAGENIKYVRERTCHMTLKKSGPRYDVWHFDCCEKEWAEPRCDSGVVDYPGLFCPWCGAKVVE